MALCACPECGQPVAESAKSCPSCGHRLRPFNWTPVKVAVVAILTVACVAWVYAKYRATVDEGYEIEEITHVKNTGEFVKLTWDADKHSPEEQAAFDEAYAKYEASNARWMAKYEAASHKERMLMLQERSAAEKPLEKISDEAVRLRNLDVAIRSTLSR